MIILLQPIASGERLSYHWTIFLSFPEQMNATFSRPRNDPHSNSYNPGWRNHPNFSWQAQANGNFAPQFNGLHNQAHSQSNTQFFQPPFNPRPPHQQ
jgi:hypothetical protein